MMKNRQYMMLAAGFIAIILVCLAGWVFLGAKRVVSPNIRAIPLEHVLIADTEALRELGLGRRESLPAGDGMLFVFDKPYQYGFWMKDMKFAIDIIWLDENFTIIDVKNDISEATYPEIFTPKRKSKFVLEVNAGIAQKNNYTVGQTLDFLKSHLHTW